MFELKTIIPDNGNKLDLNRGIRFLGVIKRKTIGLKLLLSLKGKGIKSSDVLVETLTNMLSDGDCRLESISRNSLSVGVVTSIGFTLSEDSVKQLLDSYAYAYENSQHHKDSASDFVILNSLKLPKICSRIEELGEEKFHWNDEGQNITEVEEGIQRWKAELGAILELLDQIWPEMHDVVAKLMPSFVVLPKAYFMSDPCCLGIIFLSCNVPSIKEDAVQHLIHEIMHQVIFLDEEDGPWLKASCRNNKELSKVFISPWSGRDRVPEIYAHIPVIYYVIATWYGKVLAYGTEHSPFIKKQLKFVIDGLDVFFEQSVGSDWLTEKGLSVHRELQKHFNENRTTWLAQSQ